MAFPLINPQIQFFDTNGVPLSSGTIEFRDPDTDAYINTYPTADDADAQTNANSNPITLDSRGEAANGIYLEDGVDYKVILKDSDGNTIWTQDDVRCPIYGQANIATLLWPQTTAESSLSITPTNYLYPEGNILRYGTNATPGTTDMSGALQNAINVVATAGYGDVIIPRGLYDLQDDIYLHYDASNNPNFPSAASGQGQINIVGDGWQDYAAYNNGVSVGSILDINANQIKIGDGTAQTRGVRFRNCTVQGNSTTYLIKYDLTSRGSGFEDFTLFQAGTGGGVEMDNTFLILLDNVYARTTNGSNTGIGFFIWNSSQAAGNYDFREVSAVDFNKNFVLGTEDSGVGSSMSNIYMQSCQGNGGAYNLILGNGVKAGCIDNFHNEGPTTVGVKLAWGANDIMFTGLYCSAAGSSADYMHIGQETGTNADDYTVNIQVVCSTFLSIPDGQTGIKIFSAGSCRNRRVAHCTFSALGTGDAIEIEDALGHGIYIGPNFYNLTSGTEVVNSDRADINHDGNTLGRITYAAPITHAGHAETQVNVASATDIAWIDTSNLWRITGTTTINTIAAPTAGNPIITLMFTDTLTVNDVSTSAGNIALAGNSNMSTTNQDTLQLVWNSSNSQWWEISKSAN